MIDSLFVEYKSVIAIGVGLTVPCVNVTSREKTLKTVLEESGGVLVHPYNNERIIAGQGTAAKELLEDYPDLDCIVSPVSGGGLLSGSIISAKSLNFDIQVFGAEPKEADDAFRSLKMGNIQSNETTNTICDGLRAQIGSITFPIIQEKVDRIITVSEKEIIESIKCYSVKRMKELNL